MCQVMFRIRNFVGLPDKVIQFQNKPNNSCCCAVPPVLSWLFCTSRPVKAVLPRLDYPWCHIRPSCSDCLVATCLFWLSCPGSCVLTVLGWLVMAVLAILPWLCGLYSIAKFLEAGNLKFIILNLLLIVRYILFFIDAGFGCWTETLASNNSC